MLYHLFDYLHKHYNLAGAGLFQYLTFRAAAAVILSLLLSLVVGEYVIKYLQKLQIRERLLQNSIIRRKKGVIYLR